MVSEGCFEFTCSRRAETDVTLQSKNRLLISLAAANTYSERIFFLISLQARQIDGSMVFPFLNMVPDKLIGDP